MKQSPIAQPSAQEDPQAHRPLWEMTPSEFAQFQVTPLSRGGDSVWGLAPTTPGIKKSICEVRWAMELPDGSRLTDPRHAPRLAWAQKLMALILHAPAQGRVPAPASLVAFQLGFKSLLTWMAMRGMQTPDELDVQAYIDDLPRFITDNNEEGDISVSQARLALFVLPWLWSERRLLRKWGVPTVAGNYFRDHGVDYFAKAIATKALGWIPPLPDEVSIPLFNKVAWWLGQPAEDVIRLLEVLYDPLAGTEVRVNTPQAKSGTRKQKAGIGKQSRQSRANRFLGEFTFSTLPGESQSWHAALGGPQDIDKARVRVLFNAVREACALCIQGMCGMRISELLGIEAGIDTTSGLPKGVRVEDSATGLYDAYIIHTVLSKTEEGLPREMDWVLGMIPKGSAEEPMPVRALRLLNRLHDPWRANAKTNRLILSGVSGATLPLKATAMGAMSSDKMLGAMKRFIARWVDLSKLPNESKHKIKDNDLVPWRETNGTVFKSHMLRKSWAQFMFAVDPRLLPAIQMQFHHLSIAMSDTGYIGDNPLLVGDMDSVATQARNQMILEMVMGRNPLAGKMGEQLEQATKALAEQVKDLPTSDGYAAVVDFCEHAQLPIFFSPYGACMPVHTHEMRCHDEAGTSLLLREQPNSRTRQPSLCAGCVCFVLDVRHAGFWAARYLDNWLAYKRAERRADVSGYKVIKQRAIQAGKLLKKIGVEVVQIDRQIESALERDFAID